MRSIIVLFLIMLQGIMSKKSPQQGGNGQEKDSSPATTTPPKVFPCFFAVFLNFDRLTCHIFVFFVYPNLSKNMLGFTFFAVLGSYCAAPPGYACAPWCCWFDSCSFALLPTTRCPGCTACCAAPEGPGRSAGSGGKSRG